MTSTQVQPQDVACFPKTESQEARLLAALRMNVLFQQMEPEIGSTLVQAMREKHVPKGGIVISMCTCSRPARLLTLRSRHRATSWAPRC